MFTGLIEDVGSILERKPIDDGVRLFIETSLLPEDGDTAGNSVAISGVCLTVTDQQPEGFWADVSAETLEKTTLSEVSVGDSVNLETSLTVGDEVGGHFVFGHVDDTVRIETLEERGDFHQLEIDLPGAYRPYVARKGSIALDGISLTVNEIEQGIVGIRIIPHTYRETRLRDLQAGDEMNLEVDMLARYVYNNTQYLRDDPGETLPDEPSGPDNQPPS